jgi:hypothetical protein
MGTQIMVAHPRPGFRELSTSSYEYSRTELKASSGTVAMCFSGGAGSLTHTCVHQWFFEVQEATQRA